MHKRYASSLIIAVLFFTVKCFAQSSSVSGTIKNAAGGFVSLAYVSVLAAADSLLVQTGQTDANGYFGYKDIAAGKYIIDIQALGYKNKKLLTDIKGPTHLGDIIIDPKGNKLDEVVITGRRDMIQTELGKTIVNVRESMKAGNTLLDLLQKMPGVTVGADGSINITGKEGVVVLIDDKPVRLAGQELADYLKGVGAGEVVKIELMTQPSAKYDAEGNAGIINIRMDKNRRQGWGGTANARYQQGRYPFIITSSNMTWRKNKLAFTLSPGYYLGQGFLESEKVARSKENGVTAAVITEEAFKKEIFPDYSLKAGVDYDMNDKTSLAFSAKGIYHTNTEVDKISSTIDNSLTGQTIYNVSENRNGHKRSHIELDGYLKHEIDSNRNIQLNAGSFINRRDLYQKLNSADYDVNGRTIAEPLILDNTIPDRMNLYVIKADYEMKAGKVKLECGVKGNYMTMDEENRFDRYTNGQWINDTLRTNIFLYNEAISAAYVNSTTAINKLQLQGGLRVEHTYAAGDQVTQDVQFIRNYLSLFPTAFANYKINDSHTVEANYGRRVRRPNYRDLNPFAMYASQYNVFTGNPMIAPMFTHNVELKHNFKGRFITIANWSKTLGTFIEQLVFDNTTNVTTRFYANSGNSTRASISGHYTNQVNSWLNLGLMAEGHYAEYEADYNGRHHFDSAAGFYVSADAQLSLKKGWSASGHSRYSSSRLASVVQRDGGSMWLQAEVGKSMFKDTATVKLMITDPFHTYRYVYDMDQPEVSVSSSTMYNTQHLSLAFTYNFGKRDELRRRAGLDEGRM